MDDSPASFAAVPAYASPSTPTAEATRETNRPRADEGSIKETIEQILVAFILAFIFRAYVVEAFVIPTGSMAPTLMGAHMRFTCPDCGYPFDVNFNAQQQGEDLNIPTRSVSPWDSSVLAICPNCSYKLRNSQPGDPAYAPFVRYGDRILVLKFLYLFQDPKRWDVVVFKAPDQPKQFDYQQNYIKRLIGRPGESIMILDGDIYAGAHDAEPEQMKIQTKPRDVQDALWRIISDSDYQPRGLARAPGDNHDSSYVLPWVQRTGQTGWNLGDSAPSQRTLHFENDTGHSELVFRGSANLPYRGRVNAFADWLAYDVGPNISIPQGWSRVSDLKLEFSYERSAGDGPLQLMLSKYDDRFVAEITPKSVRLLRVDEKQQQTEVIPATPIDARTGPMHVEFTNVDYCVTLRVDGREVLRTTEAQYHPDIASLLQMHRERPLPTEPQVRIAAAKQRCAISHLSLWRDVFYLSRGMRQDGLVPFSASPENVMRLNADEYFVLGDNSQISGDGRYWSDPTNLKHEELYADPGKVPGRFMLGKAFFVYWPAGYRPFESSPAIAPDFGDMRFIH